MRRVMSVLAGVLLALSFAPFHAFFLAPIALAVLFSQWVGTTPRQAFSHGYLFGRGYFGAGVHWIYWPTGVYGAGGFVAGALATPAFIAFLALFPAVLGGLHARFLPARGTPALLLWFPVSWALLDWVRSWFLTGFPWLVTGYAQTETWLGAWSPVFGVFAVSWWSAVVGGALVVLARRQDAGRGIALALLVAAWGSGFGLSHIRWTTETGESLSVSLVQGNIPQEKKWLTEQQMPTLTTYVSATRDAPPSDLIIWPETAISLFYHEVKDSVLPRLAALVEARESALLSGIIQYDFERKAYFNSVINVAQPETEWYAKRHLVPFGEYLPLRRYLGELLDILGAPLGDFQPGTHSGYWIRAAGVTLGVSICYEDAFGAEIIRALPEAGVLVNVSNDGWFGRSIAPAQHIQMAQMRARETERYLLRSTNTGISAIIDPTGQIVARSPQYAVDTLSGRVAVRTGLTPYARWGDWPVVTALLLLTGIGIIRRRQTRSG